MIAVSSDMTRPSSVIIYLLTMIMYLLAIRTIMIIVKLTNTYAGLYQLHYSHVLSSPYPYNTLKEWYYYFHLLNEPCNKAG